MTSTVQLSKDQETVVIKAGPALDFRNAALFRKQCESMAEAGANTFVVDLSETDVLDSTGLGALFTMYRHMKKQGGRIMLAAPTRAVVVVIALTKCDRIFDTYPTVEAALRSIA